MGITVELWRARIGQFSGGRGSRPYSKASSTKQPLHFSDTVGTTAKVVQGGLLLLVILKFLSSQDKSLLLKRTRNAGLLMIAIVGLVHSLAHLLLLAGDIESNPGPQMDEVLTLHDHLEDACSKLFKARTEWFNIGLTLGVDGNTLTAIRQEHSSNHGDCLREMLAHRIKATDSLTWGDLCKSLRHATVGRSDVADEIEADNVEVIFGGDSYLNETSATLMEAALNGNVRSVELLIGAGAQVNYQDEDNQTALYAASSHGHDEIVRVLLAAKATVNTGDKTGATPLWVASFIGHQKCMELLIDAGANVDVTREDGITPLYVAAQNGHVRAVKLLIAAKAQVNIQQKDGATALYIASQQGHYGVVRMLLEAKAGVHIKNNLGATPLWVASFHGQQKCMELLIDAGTNVDVPRDDGTTALYVAAQTGHVKAVEVLIAAKAQVDIQTKDGGTALLMASVYGHCGVVRMLLEAKADVNNKSNNNLTALHAASEQGHDEIVRVLLAAKATVNTQTKSGATPLWNASFNGHYKCMELLIDRDAGADVDVPNENGATALIVAAENGHVMAVEVLIAAKTKIDIQQKDGATALYIASQNGHCGIVRMLLEAKADVNIKTNNNKTALNAAGKNGHHEVVRVLLAAKTTVNTQTKITTGTPEYEVEPHATSEYTPEYKAYKANPPATPEHKANPPVTPEYEAKIKGPSFPVMEDVCKETGVSDQQLDQEIPKSDVIHLAKKFPHLLSVHKALTINDLQHVYEKLQSASPHWFNLGLALGLTNPVLINIDSKHRGDNMSSLRAMLAELLNTKDVTWSLLTDGLKKSTVDLINLADSITATTPNLLNRLNLTPADLGDVTDATHRFGNQAGVAHALRAWQRVNPSRATFRALVEIAIGLRRGDTAVDICSFIISN